MTKKQKAMYDSYKYACNKGRKTELWEVYGKYSHAKQRAMDYCKELQYRLNGYEATITGAATYFFSYAFKYFKVLKYFDITFI